ncbi:hypothetical protein ACLOJK_034137 [Asimina triloba]
MAPPQIPACPCPRPHFPPPSVIPDDDDDVTEASSSLASGSINAQEKILQAEAAAASSNEALEALGRPSKRRMKKMNKLALKRAKDWRQRVLYLMDWILKLQPNEFLTDVLNDRKWVGDSNWQRALEIYEWLNLQRWYSPSARMLATILCVLGKARQESNVEEIFIRMEAMVGNVVQVYNAMMGVYVISGKFSKVQDFLRFMRFRGSLGGGEEVDIITYNTLMRARWRASNSEEAMEVYDDMVAHRCQPDLWTYNVVISVCGRCGLAGEAKCLFHELGEKGFFPDAVTCNSLLHAFAREGNMKKVEKICEDMVRSGFGKDAITYNTIIHMYGCRPDSVTYIVLIDFLGKANQMTEAQVKSTPRTFSALNCGYGKAGMWVEAEQTFDCMIRFGIKPDHLAYYVMLDILLRCIEAHTLLEFLKEHSSGSCHFVTEALIIMLCEDQQLEGALEEYNKLRSFGSDIGLTVYEAFIRCCEETESFTTSSQLLSDMKLYVAEPSAFVYQSAIRYKEQLPPTVDRAQKNGIVFDDHSVHSTLIEAYGKVKLWQKAESLDSKVDRKVWNSLIGAYAASGRYEKAQAVFNAMTKEGPSPIVDSINGLVQALIVDGRLDEPYVVIEEPQDMGF